MLYFFDQITNKKKMKYKEIILVVKVSINYFKLISERRKKKLILNLQSILNKIDINKI